MMNKLNGTFDDFVEISTVDTFGIRSRLAFLEMGPYEFIDGKCDSEEICFIGYEELTQERIEGLCCICFELVVAINPLSFPPNRVFAVERSFGEREQRMGYRFSEELRDSLQSIFLEPFIAAAKVRGLLVKDNQRIRLHRALLSTDFSESGLEFLRKHYHPLCLKVLTECSTTDSSLWKEIIEQQINLVFALT